MNQNTINKRTFFKTAITGLAGLLGVNLVDATKKKFGYASVYKPIYRNGERVRHGDFIVEFENKEPFRNKYCIVECNDEEGWFVATGEHGASGQGFIRYETPRKFENVEFTLKVAKPWNAELGKRA